MVQRLLDDSNMNSVWAGRECKGFGGLPLWMRHWGLERLNDLSRTHNWLMSGLVSRLTEPLPIPSGAGTLYDCAFGHCWQNNLRKWKKGPKLGEDLRSWFAPSSPTSLGYQLWDELCMNMNHPGTSWNSFLCGSIMNPTTVGSNSSIPIGPSFSLTWRQDKSWSWKQVSTTTKYVFTLRLCYAY